MPAGINGVGEEILKSQNGGSTWFQCPDQGSLMYLSMAASGSCAVVSGVLSAEFTIDNGAHFNNSWNPVMGQCVRSGTSGQFFIVGQGILDSTNGVAVSTDCGISFGHVNVTGFETDARYGAFVDGAWYVSAGSWPDQSPRGGNVHELTEKIQVVRDPLTGARKVQYVKSRAGRNGQYQCQIAKSTDKGKTWSIVYSNMAGDFYPNGIGVSPSNPNHACFVAEADSGAAPGAHIFCTTDGGANWVEAKVFQGAQYSLMDILFVSDTDIWVVGGDMSGTMLGYYLHSTDGGKTWDNSANVPGVYGNSLSFPDAAHGFSAAFTVMGDSSVLAYK